MKHQRGKYLRGADGKRASLECYAQMDSIATMWLMAFREAQGDNDDIIQWICDFTHAYYIAADEQKPAKLEAAYGEWKASLGKEAA